MKKSVLFICVALLNVLVLSSCSKDDEVGGNNELLIGKWYLESKESSSSALEGGAAWLEFLGSGDYIDADGGSGSWSLKGDKLKATPTIGIPVEYTVLELTENKLKIKMSVKLGGETLTMTLVYAHYD